MLPRQQKEPLLQNKEPTGHFESVLADFFTVAASNFIVAVNRLSALSMMVALGSETTSAAIICHFRNAFNELDIPASLIRREDPSPLAWSSKDSWSIDEAPTTLSMPHYLELNGPHPEGGPIR